MFEHANSVMKTKKDSSIDKSFGNGIIFQFYLNSYKLICVQMFLLRILDNDRRSFHWFMLQAMAYNNRTEVKFQKQIAKQNKICLVRA